MLKCILLVYCCSFFKYSNWLEEHYVHHKYKGSSIFIRCPSRIYAPWRLLLHNTSKQQKRAKSFNLFMQFLACLTMGCALRLVQCQVQSKDRLTMTTQWPCTKILTSKLRFEREYGSLDDLDVLWMDWIFCYLRTLLIFLPKACYFCGACYS